MGELEEAPIAEDVGLYELDSSSRLGVFVPLARSGAEKYDARDRWVVTDPLLKEMT
jgi:hypothetical protein